MNASGCVFFFDCDNTLLDNDRFKSDLNEFLERESGAAAAAKYWAIYDQLRRDSGYADYLGAARQLGPDALTSFLMDYPFASRVYDGAREAIAHCSAWGTTAILSDGDTVFQPRKLRRSGLWDAVDGRVLIQVHKEKVLDDVLRRYPASHYVMVDDKLSILTAMKAILRTRLTTVWPRQGHYALEAGDPGDSAPDISLERIGDLAQIDFSAILATAGPAQPAE